RAAGCPGCGSSAPRTRSPAGAQFRPRPPPPPPMRRLAPLALLAPALGALALAAPAVAQIGPPGGMPATALTGRVLDDATGEGIPLATVALFAEGAFVTGTAADDAGAF